MAEAQSRATTHHYRIDPEFKNHMDEFVSKVSQGYYLKVFPGEKS